VHRCWRRERRADGADTADIAEDRQRVRRDATSSGYGAARSADNASPARRQGRGHDHTVVRQIAFYVRTRHPYRAAQRELTAERIGEICFSDARESLGPAIDIRPGYENFWMYIPHFIHSPVSLRSSQRDHARSSEPDCLRRTCSSTKLQCSLGYLGCRRRPAILPRRLARAGQ